MKALLLVLSMTGLLLACQNLQYGQIGCDKLEGKAARICQEYRKHKADADIREETGKLLALYRECVQKNPADNNCSKYLEALKAVKLEPLGLTQ